MKNITLITGIILLVVNVLFGSILSSYPAFNMGLNCGVIVATTVLLYATVCNLIELSNHYKQEHYDYIKRA